MTILKTQLTLNRLELNIHLGCFQAEIEKKQKIWIDIKLNFSTPPNACQTDRLEDTVCYGTLSEILGNSLQDQAFKTLETLAYQIFRLTKAFCGEDIQVNIGVTKQPTLSYPNQGATFWYGEF